VGPAEAEFPIPHPPSRILLPAVALPVSKGLLGKKTDKRLIGLEDLFNFVIVIVGPSRSCQSLKL
jgi:hypothetical protein